MFVGPQNVLRGPVRAAPALIDPATRLFFLDWGVRAYAASNSCRRCQSRSASSEIRRRPILERTQSAARDFLVDRRAPQAVTLAKFRDCAGFAEGSLMVTLCLPVTMQTKRTIYRSSQHQIEIRTYFFLRFDSAASRSCSALARCPPQSRAISALMLRLIVASFVPSRRLTLRHAVRSSSAISRRRFSHRSPNATRLSRFFTLRW